MRKQNTHFDLKILFEESEMYLYLYGGGGGGGGGGGKATFKGCADLRCDWSNMC